MVRFLTYLFFKDLFFIYLFILFIFGCVGSQLRHVRASLRYAGSSVAACGLLSSCGVQPPGHVGSVVCGTQALAEALELSSCGTRALVEVRKLSSCGRRA